MNTENSRKAFLQEIDFEVGDSVLLELPNIRSFKKGYIWVHYQSNLDFTKGGYMLEQSVFDVVDL